jgi:hypothetical protein
MSQFKSFRIGKNLFKDDLTEFYLKIADDKNHFISNFAVDENGILL